LVLQEPNSSEDNVLVMETAPAAAVLVLQVFARVLVPRPKMERLAVALLLLRSYSWLKLASEDLGW